MRETQKNSKKKHLAATALAVAVWLALWYLVWALVGKEYLVPSPHQTAGTFLHLLVSGAFWEALGVTLLRVCAGLLLSLAAAVPLSALSVRFGFLRVLMGQLVSFFKAVPVMSVIMFAILCIVSGWVPVFVSFLMCFPILFVNLSEGYAAVPKEYLEVGDLYTGSWFIKFRTIVFPLSRGYLRAALDLCAGLAWKTVIAAEVLASPAVSMGYHLFLSKMYFDAASLFAWTIAVVLASVLFGRAVRFLAAKL